MHELCSQSGIRLAKEIGYDRECQEPHQDSAREPPAAAEDGWQVEFEGEVAVDEPEELQQAVASAAEQGCLARPGHRGRGLFGS